MEYWNYSNPTNCLTNHIRTMVKGWTIPNHIPRLTQQSYQTRSDAKRTRVRPYFLSSDWRVVRIRVLYLQSKPYLFTWNLLLFPIFSNCFRFSFWFCKIMEMERIVEFPHTYMDRPPRKRARLGWDIAEVPKVNNLHPKMSDLVFFWGCFMSLVVDLVDFVYFRFVWFK